MQGEGQVQTLAPAGQLGFSRNLDCVGSSRNAKTKADGCFRMQGPYTVSLM